MNVKNFKDNPAFYREEGKRLLFRENASEDDKQRGIQFLLQAAKLKDAEAQFLIGGLLLERNREPFNEKMHEEANLLISLSANQGYIPARKFLNALHDKSYKEYTKNTFDRNTYLGKPLHNFDGKPIKIHRTGIRTPIDAVLEFKDGKNILTLSTNLFFLVDDTGDINYRKVQGAVCDGVRAWEGEYEVFGGQQLTVKVDVTTKTNLYDNINVVIMTDEVKKIYEKQSNLVGKFNKDAGEICKEVFVEEQRSSAMSAGKWSTTTRKYMFIRDKTGRFDDYEELKHVAKHEFGHMLGLGDLYREDKKGMFGVEKGKYLELDSYHIKNEFYNLVMCDHHGPISNNDIEMVVLAFSTNEQQLYQPTKTMKKISEALGRGN